MAIVVRTAERSDIPSLVRIHVDAWRVAYRGVIDAGYLDSPLMEEQRSAMWNRWSWIDVPGQSVIVAEVDGTVTGFSMIGPERGADGTFTDRGEVYAFYFHPSTWGSGAATPTMERSHELLRAEGFTEATLWVLRDNPRARRFYEKMGWAPNGNEGSFTGPQTADALPYAVSELQYATLLG